MGHVAVPVVGSTSRKVAQPLVRHIGRVDELTDRRRMRRIELARPARDAVVVRESIGLLIPSAHGRGLGDCANMVSLDTVVMGPERDGCPGGVPGAIWSLHRCRRCGLTDSTMAANGESVKPGGGAGPPVSHPDERCMTVCSAATLDRPVLGALASCVHTAHIGADTGQPGARGPRPWAERQRNDHAATTPRRTAGRVEPRHGVVRADRHRSRMAITSGESSVADARRARRAIRARSSVARR